MPAAAVELESTFVPNPGQRRAQALLMGPQRNTMLVGGSRSGKTALFTRAVLMRGIREPSRHTIIRHRFNAVRASVWLDTLPKVAKLCFPGVELRDHLKEGYVSLPNGSEIWMLGLDDPARVDKVLGMEFATIYLNEASQIPYASVLVARTRLAQKTALRQRLYCDINPTGTNHWTHRLFIEGRDPVSKATLPNPQDYRYCRLNPAENAANLDPEYLADLERLPTKARQRFWEGLYVAEVEGALWSLDAIDASRCAEADVPQLVRVVTAVDPSGASGPEQTRNDEIGICSAGIDAAGVVYVLEDGSLRESPEKWAQRAILLHGKHKGDKIIGEGNFGGDMVRAVIQAAPGGKHVPYGMVTASRGKAVRAEPVSTLSASGKLRLVGEPGSFAELVEEMTNFTTSGYVGSRSPNRADAMVFAVTELTGGAAGWIHF